MIGKKQIANLIAKRLTEKQKRQMIQVFYEKHKHNPEVDSLIEAMKKQLGYDKDDVPRRD